VKVPVSMKLIDTHAHLEDIERLDETLGRAEKIGVVAVITMGSDYGSNLWVLEESVKYQRNGLRIHPALGLHPWGLNPSKIDVNLSLIEENIGKAVALGEIGLDYWYKEAREDEERKKQQRILFQRLLEIAERNGKPASIHSRGAWKDCLDITIKSGIEKAVFHWFSGPLDILRELLDQGYYVSATPAAVYSKEHIRVVKETPLENLLLETDSPVPYKGEPAEPSHILKTLIAVAELKSIKEEIVAERTTENARLVFKI